MKSYIDYFHKRIQIISNAKAQCFEEIAREDLIQLTTEILQYTSSQIDLSELNHTITLQSRIDITSLNDAYLELNKIKWDSVITRVHDGSNIDYKEKVKWLGELINNLRRQQDELPLIEIMLRLEMAGDSCFSTLLMYPDLPKNTTDVILSLIRKKISLLDKDGIHKIWSIIRSEVTNENEEDKIRINPTVVGIDFFTADTEKTLKEKIVKYIVIIRPRLILHMWQGGPCSTPMQVPGIAKILSWNEAPRRYGISEREHVAFKSVARIVHLWDKIPTPRDYIGSHSKEQAICLLKMDGGDRLFNAPECDLVDKELEKSKDRERLLIIELRRLLEILSVTEKIESNTERILRQYKLGLEVVSETSRKNVNRHNELHLQKEMCRFLLERGLYSVGTRFGRNEIDLVTDETNESIVIEVKKYKSVPSDRTFKAHLNQLVSYLDSHIKHQRGILAIYNLSNTLITAPNIWARNQFRVLVINLMHATPSKRFKKVSIVDDEKAIFRIVRD